MADRFTMTLDVPIPTPQHLRGIGGQATFELCDRCWMPVLAGKLDDHLRALPHRQPPMAANTPEG